MFPFEDKQESTWNIGEMQGGEPESPINNRLFLNKNTNGSNLGIYFFCAKKTTVDQIQPVPMIAQIKFVIQIIFLISL